MFPMENYALFWLEHILLMLSLYIFKQTSLFLQPVPCGWLIAVQNNCL